MTSISGQAGPIATAGHGVAHFRPHDGKGRDRDRPDDKHRKREGKPDKSVVQPAPPEAENRLRRETPFICHVRFKNDLPEIPSDPKMLVAQVQPEKLSEFFLTEFETEPKRDLILPQDLGIPLSLLDVERYQVPEVRPPLDEADAALLGDEDDRAVGLKSGGIHSAARFKPRMRNAELSWLLKTTYISNDTESTRGTGLSEKQAKALNQGVSDETTLADQIALIEATFDAAKKPPVHHKNPSLKPLKVLQVLPDFDNWANKYVTAAFDNNPCEEVDALARVNPKIRQHMASRCMLKGFKLDSRDNNPQMEQKFMALIVPKNIPKNLPTGDNDDRELEAEEGEYVWCKEYAYSIETNLDIDDPTQMYILRFRDDSVTYSQLYARLELKKKKKEIDFPRPSKVTVKRRPMNANEEAEKESKIRRLYGEEEDDGLALNDDDA